MIVRIVRAAVALAVALAVVSASAAAQFSSDFPGVPRGAISIRGGKQARTEWSLLINKAPTATGVGDTTGAGLRIGIGRSYRVADQFEVGFDYTFMDLTFQQPPSPPVGTPKTDSYKRGLLAYAFRFGAKIRPYSSIDQEGNGYQVAFGAAYQPTLKALYGIESVGDSTRTGGQFADKKTSGPASTVFKQNPFASVQSSFTIAAMGSYRAKRILADAALMNESAAKGDATADSSPIQGYDGFSLRLAGAYRVTRSIAIGAAYWGSGSPPWRDEVRIGVPGNAKPLDFALLFQFGSEPEGGTDLMVTSPTGNFAQSIRIYLRTRATR